MESQKPRIALYAKRTFGGKLNASFDFIKENWRPLLKYVTYLLLPVCLIQALSLNGIMGGVLTANTQVTAENAGMVALANLMSHYGAYMLLYLIGTVVLSALIYALIRVYGERENRLQGITLRELKPLLLHNVKRLCLMVVACVVLMSLVGVLLGVLASLSWYTLFLMVPLLIAFSVPLTLWAPIYLFEDISIWQSFKKTFRLGFATWGGIFLVCLVMGIVSNVLQGVTMIPWYIATLVKYFFALSDTGSTATVSPGYNFFLYLLGILQTFGSYLAMVFVYIGLVYQYGHASEVVDSVTIESEIDNFDKL